ncbi:unnamed protein product [Clonostachys chloroleuca]|uniref:Mandelate racemase/muconate lactonizing enzyme C-terminal domain-containing protein n=1 Tax=Clonostachys chloroleuca TaxID=1926264 RepID=A0AA35PU88_9HYPO|nr:unnamed protein product [Clonostachys chloroleuca]
MKINDITVFSYNAKPSSGIYVMSGGRKITGKQSIVIRVCTDDGIEGWAETCPLGSDYLPSSYAGEIEALKELGPKVLGLDPRSPPAIAAVMDKAMISGMAAKAVIDMACWDAFGKSVGLPTYVLLGGNFTEDPPAFCVIPLGDPELGVKNALAELEKGFVAMQLKAGDDPLVDARRVKAIREALPDHVTVWADANGGWNLGQALTYARALGPTIGVPLEQPCRSLSDSAEVGRRTGLPILLDECIVTMADLVTAHAAGVTGVNIKPSRVGGLTKARTLRDAAVALDMVVSSDDTWGCSLATAQNLQLAVSTHRDRFRAVDLFTEWTTPMIAEIPRIKGDGRIDCSPLPGNGFGAIDAEILGEPLFHITS